jgi:FixJ family two-component response regulator
VVLVVDDHDAVREALRALLASVGIPAVGYSSAQALLDSELLESPGCLILDVRMPGMGGLALQEHLLAQGSTKPVIFVTGHGDIAMSVQAMKAGAIDFLTKPFREQALLDAVAAAIAADVRRRTRAATVKRHVERFERLTQREREVLHEVARGRLNKQIGFDLGISEVTVKLHRGNVMRKMEAISIGELIQAWQSLPDSVRHGHPVVSAVGVGQAAA